MVIDILLVVAGWYLLGLACLWVVKKLCYLDLLGNTNKKAWPVLIPAGPIVVIVLLWLALVLFLETIFKGKKK